MVEDNPQAGERNQAEYADQPEEATQAENACHAERLIATDCNKVEFCSFVICMFPKLGSLLQACRSKFAQIVLEAFAIKLASIKDFVGMQHLEECLT